MKKRLAIFLSIFASCNTPVGQYKHDINLFEKYTALQKKEYKISEYKFLNDQTMIKANITDDGVNTILAAKHFTSYQEFIKEVKKNNIPNISFKLYKIDQGANTNTYYFDDHFKNIYSYCIIVLNKSTNQIIYCLNYGN